MEMTVTKQIGKHKVTFIVQGKNLFELQMEAQKLSFYDVPTCGECGSDNLYLNAYITTEDEFKYVKIICAKCKSSITFGQPKKSPDTHYLRKNDDGKLDWQKPNNEYQNPKDGLPF